MFPPGRGANVTVGRISDMIQKNYVPQQGVKPWPLAIRVGIIPLDHEALAVTLQFIVNENRVF